MLLGQAQVAEIALSKEQFAILAYIGDNADSLSDFGKHFVPQMQLSVEQAFWLPFSNPKYKHPNDTQTSVRVGVPKELPKKELKLKNERLLKHIICQDVVNTVMHADVKSDNVLPMQNTFLDDNIALDVWKIENDRLMTLLVS
nr:hypothetical protein [Tanacetum cinerariifolium]